MLTALRLGNFKAFADIQRLPIRPLTLIFGANSSGKSSLIHGLLLARHAMETGELDAHRTAIGGESVDLGGFRQYVHRREPARRFEWAGEIDVALLQGRLAELLASVHRATVSLSVGIELGDQGEPLQEAIPVVMSYEIEADGVSILRMSRRRDGHLQLDRLDHEHPVFRGVIRAIVETATTTEALTATDFEGLDDAIAAMVPEITVQVEKFLPIGLVRSEHPVGGTDQPTLFPISRGRRKEDLAAAVSFFLPRTLDELIRGLNDAVARELSRLRYLGPLRSYPPRHLAFSQHHDPNWFAGGGYAWEVVRRDESMRAAVNAWLGSEKRLQTSYELVVRDLVPDRVIARELSPRIAKALHDMLRDLLRPAAAIGDEHQSLDLWAAELSEALERATPTEILPDIEGIISNLVDSDMAAEQWTRELARASVDQLRDLVLIDKHTNTPVSHRDIGIGISQVLPVLVSAYSSAEKILAIEQPEIHLHPALQAELSDVFIESALGGRRNTFILETHSEHLILRIKRRMRDTVQGTLPDGLPPVHPEDVAILYVQPRDSAAVVRLLELDEEGELLDPWPGGVFEEGFRERFTYGEGSVLYEFAMTPDVFATTVVDGDQTLGVVLVQLLRGMCDNGLIANLHRDRWARHVMEHRLTRLSPALRDKVIACLNTLHDRHRLVRHPRRMQGDPTVDGEWLELALESHRRIPFHSIILSKALLSECADSNIVLTELSGALDSPQWQSRRRSFTLTKCDVDYRAALAPILRHARTLTLIDPYMSCRDSRFFNTVKICIDLLGQRGHAVLPARIHIHAGNPQDNYHRPESVVNCLSAWEQYLRPLMDTQHPHHFKVFLWEAYPGRETFHDRYILTDQCGISVPSGLNCRADSAPNSTTWSLLDEEDRVRRLQDFDPATSSFRLLGEKEVL